MAVSFPTAAERKMVRAAASITGVARMPRGWMLPQGAFGPFIIAGVPTFFIQTIAPVARRTRRRRWWVVTAKKTPLPPGPFSMKSGEAHMSP